MDLIVFKNEVLKVKVSDFIKIIEFSGLTKSCFSLLVVIKHHSTVRNIDENNIKI